MTARNIVFALAMISFAIAVITWYWGEWRQRNKPQEQDYKFIMILPESVGGKLQKGDTLTINGFAKGYQQMKITDIKGDEVSVELAE